MPLGSPHSCTNAMKSSNFYREFLRYPKFWVFGPPLSRIYLLKMAKIKNSYRVIQMNQNQGPISIQFSLKTIARIFPVLVSFFILSDIFFDFEPIFKCYNQSMEKVNWLSRSRTLCLIFWKKIIKKIEYSRSLSDPENYWCGHQQPYNFFPISRHFLITQENENQLI